jgi:hypothetical protein
MHSNGVRQGFADGSLIVDYQHSHSRQVDRRQFSNALWLRLIKGELKADGLMLS